MPRSVIPKQMSKPTNRIIRFVRFSWPRSHQPHMPPDRTRPSGSPYRAFRVRSGFHARSSDALGWSSSLDRV